MQIGRLLSFATLTFTSFALATDPAETGPRLKAVIACHNGKLDSGSKCSVTCYQPDGTLHETGKLTCGWTGTVSEIEWKFLERRGVKDVYRITRRFPVGSPNVATTSKEVEFEGQQVRVFEDKSQCIVIACPAKCVCLADEPAARAAQKPLRAKELSGTWRGERDGAKVEITFKGDEKATWRVDTRKSEKASAVVQADMRRVDSDGSGQVELRLDLLRDAAGRRPFIRMGRLTRGQGGSLNLTILPTAREQSESYYRLVEDLPLNRVEGQE